MPRERQTCTRCSMRRQRCDRNAPCQRCVRAGEAKSCTRTWHGGYDARIHRRYPTSQLPTDFAEETEDTSDRTPIVLYGQLHADQKTSLARILPPFQSIVQLLDYHGNSLLWYHASLSARHFRIEFDQAWDPERGLVLDTLDLQWSGLLLATMAASIICAPEVIIGSWNFRPELAVELASKWYRAALACIKTGMKMSGPNIRSVQAIQILFMSAGRLGFMQVQLELFNISRQIAQALGFCQISYKATLDILASQKDSHVDAEPEIFHPFAQQIWTQLCLQHWLARRSIDTLRSIAMKSMRKASQIANSSQPFKGDFATTAEFRSYLEETCTAIAHSYAPDYVELDFPAKYENVLKLDMKLRSIDTMLKERPQIGQEEDRSPQSNTRALHLISSHLMLLTHHEFFMKSFVEHQYMYSRWASVTAAKEIICDMEAARSEGGRFSLWNYLSTVFAALVTLSLNVTNLAVIEAEYTEQRELIDRAIVILQQSCYFRLICNFPTNINEC